MNGKIGLRIVSALVLIAAIAGITFFAFQAGIAKGSPVTIEAPSGQTVPAPYPFYGYGYGMPFHRPFGLDSALDALVHCWRYSCSSSHSGHFA